MGKGFGPVASKALGGEPEEHLRRWRRPCLSTRLCDRSFRSPEGAGDGASSQDVGHNTHALFVTARSASSECSQNKPTCSLPASCTNKSILPLENSSELRWGINQNRNELILPYLCWPSIANRSSESQKIPSSGMETAMTLSPHTKTSSAQKEVLFLVVFQMKTMLSPKPQSPLFHLTFLNAIYWQMFSMGHRGELHTWNFFLFPLLHISLKISQSAITQWRERVPRSGYLKGPFIWHRVCELSVSAWRTCF